MRAMWSLRPALVICQPLRDNIFIHQADLSVCKRLIWRSNMKKWYDEEYEFEIAVTEFLRGDHTERYCPKGEEVINKYTCTYGCPVNADG